MLNFLFIFLLLMFSSLSAQETAEDAELQNGHPVAQEDSVQFSDDQREEIETMLEKNKEEAAKLQAVLENASPVHSKKSIKNLIPPNSLSDTRSFAEISKQAISSFESISESEVRKLVFAQMKKSQIGPYLKENSRIPTFVAKMLKDKNALPALCRVLDNKEKLMLFGGVQLILFLVGFYLKFLMKSDGFSPVRWIFRTSFMIVLRVGVALLFYSRELLPTVGIVKSLF